MNFRFCSCFLHLRQNLFDRFTWFFVLFWNMGFFSLWPTCFPVCVSQLGSISKWSSPVPNWFLVFIWFALVRMRLLFLQFLGPFSRCLFPAYLLCFTFSFVPMVWIKKLVFISILIVSSHFSAWVWKIYFENSRNMYSPYNVFK